MAENDLPWYEYFLVGVVLLTSFSIGMTFRFIGGRQKTTKEYITADSSLSVLPVTLSMYMSFMSGITVLGNAAEVHTHGVQDWLHLSGTTVGHILAVILTLPVLYHLKVTSIFEYFDGRFKNRAVRRTGSALAIIGAILYMGAAMYTPAISISAMTPIPAWGILLLMGGLATIYTSVGGLKAVVWSDTFQGIVLIGGALTIAVIGTETSGGINHVWDTLQTGHRAWTTFEATPIIRMSFWSCLVTSIPSVIVSSPVGIQRLCSMKSLLRAQIAVLLVIPLKIMFTTITFIIGGAIFTYYTDEGCDPLLSQQLDSPNELLPTYVQDVLQKPVLPGLLMSMLLVGALSSITSSMNTNAMLTWKDFMEHRQIFKDMLETKRALIIKLMSFIYGCIGILMSFAFKIFPGHALQVANSVVNSTTSPLVGMFLLGAFFPWANTAGVITGAMVSFAFHFTIGLGASMINPYPLTLNSTLVNCPENTTVDPDMLLEKDVTIFFKFSHHYFVAMGVSTCIIVGLVVSFATGPTKPEEVDPKYIIPFFDKLFCCFPERWRRTLWCGVDHDQQEKQLTEKDDEQSRKTDELLDTLDAKPLANTDWNGISDLKQRNINSLFNKNAPNEPFDKAFANNAFEKHEETYL